MLLLSIDTCGSSGTIALARLEGDALTVVAQRELAGKTYSAQLIPSIRELLSSQGTSVPDLAGIVVTRGPGSFTGIRIALSTAKALAEVHQIPIVAVSRLAVLAYKAGTRAAALDASRGEFYLGEDFGGDGRESLRTRDEFQGRAASLGENLAICENSACAAAPAANLAGAPTAEDALRYALPRLRARDYDDPVTLDGNYLRRSDAEIFSKPKLVAQP